MNKRILSLAAGLLMSATVIGCGGNGNNGGNGGTGGTGGGGSGGSGGGGGTPDMGFACVKSPATDTDFLNSCPPSGDYKVVISPQFPTLAPNGVLPQLQ